MKLNVCIFNSNNNEESRKMWREKMCGERITMVMQFMLAGQQLCAIFCVNVHISTEYLNGNSPIGKLLQHGLRLLRLAYEQGQTANKKM